MRMPSRPGYAALRRHRWSAIGVDYFITVNARRPTTAFANVDAMTAIRAAAERLEIEKVWSLRCEVTMPDHVHLLITLGGVTSLSSAMRLFKGRLAPILRRAGTQWQEGYFEHRLRADDDRLPVFLYIFLNPYRANLVPTEAKWEGYWCADEDWAWFGPLTQLRLPYPEWLAAE